MSQRCGRWVPLLGLFFTISGCGGAGDVDLHLRSAEAAISAGELDSASLALNNVLQKRPGDTEARLLLARVSLAAGRPQLSVRQARAAARLDKTGTEAPAVLCEAMLALGEFDQIIVEFEPTSQSDLALCRAHALLHRSEIADARVLLNELLKTDPGMTRARVALAKASRADGAIDLAEQQLREALEADPFSIAAHHALGALLSEQERYEEAAMTLRDALGLAKNLDNIADWINVRVALTEVHWRLGDKSEANSRARNLLDEFPSHPLPKYLRALLAYEESDFALASEYLRGVLSALPNHRPSQQLSAASDLAQGRLGSAQIHLNDEQAANTDEPLLLLLLSRIYYGMGNAEEAASTIERVQDADLDAVALTHRARARQLVGNTTGAQDDLARAVETNPDDIELQIRLATTYLNNGKIGDSDALMATWPVDTRTQEARSTLQMLRFLRAGQLDRSDSTAKRRRRSEPNDLIALLALAEAAELRGTRDQAIAWLEMARERNPLAAEPRFLLANYARRTGLVGRMRELAEELLTIQPFNSEALGLLGESYLAAGDTFAAMETLREASRVSPSAPSTAFAMLRAQLATGDFWRARRDIKKSIMRQQIPVAAIEALIFEEQRRGNAEQARALADDLLDSEMTRTDGERVIGDLHLLAGEFSEAQNAYALAQERTSTRMLALKSATSALAANNRNASRFIDVWLESHPKDAQMRRVKSAIEDRPASVVAR